MKKINIIIRILLGLVFLIFGLNGFFQFLPMPPLEGAAGEFISLLISSKLIFVIKGIEICCALFLLSGFFIPLALILLAPIIFNIFWFHLMLAPQGAPMGIGLLALECILLVGYRKSFMPLLKCDIS